MVGFNLTAGVNDSNDCTCNTDAFRQFLIGMKLYWNLQSQLKDNAVVRTCISGKPHKNIRGGIDWICSVD